jgi:hypothetical protein
MRGVRKERSPILRGQALPNTIQQIPSKDVIHIREVQEDAQLYRKDFDSNSFQFLPSFADFLTDHVNPTIKDMTEKIMVYKDLFYRTAIFQGAPSVWVCGNAPNELMASSHWTSPNIALSKDTTELQRLIAAVGDGQGGALTLEALKKLGVVMYSDIASTPYSGDILPDGTDGAFLGEKYVLVCSTEVWDGFTNPGTGGYLLDNKALDLDIIKKPFRGSLFGQWTTMPERFEIRITNDGVIVAPETQEIGPTAYNQWETVMNPAYVDAPFGVAFAVGAEAYKAITVGPPPSLFASGSLSIDAFQRMDWNGKVHITRNILVPTLDEAGSMVLDTNKRGEYLMLIADIVLGILPIQRRNIVPIIYRRQRISTSS